MIKSYGWDSRRSFFYALGFDMDEKRKKNWSYDRIALIILGGIIMIGALAAGGGLEESNADTCLTGEYSRYNGTGFNCYEDQYFNGTINGSAAYNTCIGGQTCKALTNPASNTIVGGSSATKLTTSTGNSILGSAAMPNVVAGSNYNAGMGVSVFNSLNGGDYNTGVGGACGYNLSTGNYNIFFGS